MIYFIKVNIAIALFYLFYRLFFSGDTLWRIRRYYLIFSILISFTYPFLSITDWMKQSKPVQDMLSNYSIMLQEVTITAGETTPVDYAKFFYLFYMLVAGFLFIRLLIQCISIIRIGLSGKKRIIEQTAIIEINQEIAPFSFFNNIFMNPALHADSEIKEILTHELTHVRQLHSIDVLIGECLSIVCWINPASWLMKREIRQNLEFLTDNHVIESGIDAKSYQYHLVRLAYQSPKNKLTNNFNISPLKKRITMMNQKKTPLAGMIKYLLILPLASALIISSNAENMMNSVKQAAKQQEKSAKQLVTSGTGTSAESQLDELVVVGYVASPPPPPAASPSPPPPPPPPPPVENEDVVFMVVEKMPVFPGGDAELFAYLSTNIRYPAEARETKSEGRVICSFVIEKDGSINEVEVVKSVSPSLDEEAVRVISAMPNWTPGEQRGQQVRVKYTLPINFKLGEKKDGKPE